MKLLYAYLRNYTGLVALALVLATINQVFSLLDPLIFRHVIDQYATRFQEYTTGQFFKGVSLLLSAAVVKRLTAAGVDRWVRGEPNASDHAPAWIEIKPPAARSKR